ncbi:hypothetical protein KQI84_09140 [bacterium]|nr:hypothetical protein [bacterium]
MAIRLEPATEEYEEGVTALFARMGLPVEPNRWLRAYSPEAPADYPSVPFVALDEDDQPVGFMGLRPIQLHVDHGFLDAQVMHDIVADPDQDAGRTVHAMILEAAGQAVVTLVGGAPPALSPLLELERFELAGYIERFCFRPAKAGKGGAMKSLPFDLERIHEFPPAVEDLNHGLVSERKVFSLRRPDHLTWHFAGPFREFEIYASRDNSPLDAYAVISEVPGVSGPELHVEDFAAPILEADRMVLALQKMARERERDLYWSVISAPWSQKLIEYGFERLRPRWPLHWLIGDPLEKNAGRTLVRSDVWFQTPADLCLDRY